MTLREIYMYAYLPRDRKPRAAGAHEWSMIQPRAAKWWIVRAENAEQARQTIKAGYIADRPDEPGLLDSNVVPSLVRARMARIEQRERTGHLETSGPREGLPRHESPAGIPIEMFSSSAIQWGTTAPYWMGEPEAIARRMKVKLPTDLPALGIRRFRGIDGRLST